MSTLRLLGSGLSDDVLAQIADGLARLGGLGLAENADLVSGTTTTQVTVAVQELPDSPQQEHGQDSQVRLADALVMGPMLPQKDDTIVIPLGRHAGTWHVLGLERRDAVCAIVHLRLATVRASRAPGMREVLR